jgi:hypothetical protein
MLGRYFNWKKNPAGVFWPACALFVLGFGNMLSVAVLRLLHDGEWGYLAICAGGIGLLVFGGWHMWPKLFEESRKDKTERGAG